MGLQIDLRYDDDTIKELKEKNLKPITTSQGIKLAKQIKAHKYIECSSLTRVSVIV